MELIIDTASEEKNRLRQNNDGEAYDIFRDEDDHEAPFARTDDADDDDGSSTRFRTIDAYLQNAVDEQQMLSSSSSSYPWQYWVIFLSLGVANSSDATEVLCLSYILADDRFQQHFLSSETATSSAGNLAAAVFLGMLIGGLCVGTAGDVYGRRPVLLTGCFVNATAGVVASGTSHLALLTLCRLVAGLGIGATVP